MKSFISALLVTFVLLVVGEVNVYAGGTWSIGTDNGTISDSNFPNPKPSPANPNNPEPTRNDTECKQIIIQVPCGKKRKCWDSGTGTICEDVPVYCPETRCVK